VRPQPARDGGRPNLGELRKAPGRRLDLVDGDRQRRHSGAHCITLLHHRTGFVAGSSAARTVRANNSIMATQSDKLLLRSLLGLLPRQDPSLRLLRKHSLLMMLLLQALHRAPSPCGSTCISAQAKLQGWVRVLT
jgi:hypothetical protein